jgi:hypothetical protein
MAGPESTPAAVLILSTIQTALPLPPAGLRFLRRGPPCCCVKVISWPCTVDASPASWAARSWRPASTLASFLSSSLDAVNSLSTICAKAESAGEGRQGVEYRHIATGDGGSQQNCHACTVDRHHNARPFTTPEQAAGQDAQPDQAGRKPPDTHFSEAGGFLASFPNRNICGFYHVD